MSLYIRLSTNFFSHRKTQRLRAALKSSDAYWIPTRLWTYAAEHQPNGDFSGYTSEELAMLIGCDKYATSMLQALKDCGFVNENGTLHNWEKHNSYHTTYSERAKKAAKARWSKSPSPNPPTEKTGKERIGKETSIATSMLQASEGGEIPALNMCQEYASNPACGFPSELVEEWFNKSSDRGWGQDWRARMRGAVATYRGIQNERNQKNGRQSKYSGATSNQPSPSDGQYDGFEGEVISTVPKV